MKFQTTRDRKIPFWSKEFKDWVLNEVNKAIEEANNVDQSRKSKDNYR